MKQLLLAGCTALLLQSCGADSVVDKAYASIDADTNEVADSLAVNQLLRQTGTEILNNLKEGSYQDLSEFIHPKKGVRFSAYCYIDTTRDLRFKPTEFADLLKKNPKKIWGQFDGEGNPIDMTFDQYNKRFIYDVDFLEKGTLLVNKSKGFSLTIDNREQIYKDKPFVCCYFPGSEPKLEDMEWRSLHLIFEIEQGKPYLIGVIHSEWTI